jgi:tRNA (cmo5U34)-methyltransferase
MSAPWDNKSTLAEIQARFDRDVERFANSETGHAAIMDSVLVLELIAQAALRSTPQIRNVLDIGCGAGNNALKLSHLAPAFDCDLVDLSRPMLERARHRLAAVHTGAIRLFQGDFRELPLAQQRYDVILAGAVLHHLRDDRDWESVFAKIFQLTAPGGSVWITDLVSHENEAVQALMWQRYGDYLLSVGAEAYRDKVFAYIVKEDSPRPVTYQLELLRRVGFDQVELLHKNTCFAAFGAIRSR